MIYAYIKDNTPNHPFYRNHARFHPLSMKTKHKNYEALTWEEAALTRSRRVLFQHEILGIQAKHVSPKVMEKIRSDLEISKGKLESN